MSNTNTGGPAFPVFIVDRPKELAHFNGMTLRDYFAAKAMQGWIATYPDNAAAQDVNTTGIADFAYEMADAMLKARGS
jgi:hypothetical protein